MGRARHRPEPDAAQNLPASPKNGPNKPVDTGNPFRVNGKRRERIPRIGDGAGVLDCGYDTYEGVGEHGGEQAAARREVG